METTIKMKFCSKDSKSSKMDKFYVQTSDTSDRD